MDQSSCPSDLPQNYAIYEAYVGHSSGQRIHTQNLITDILLRKYTSHDVISTTCNLTSFAEAGLATATIGEDIRPRLPTVSFKPGPRYNADGTPSGTLEYSVTFAEYDYHWQGHHFLVFEIEGQNDPPGEGGDHHWYVLSPFDSESGRKAARALIEKLLLAVGIWEEENHDEVWVFDQGRWTKDKTLWTMVQRSNWEDLILDEGTKSAIMRDVVGFFDAKHLYNDLGAPWKRGLLLHGPPGNGKTMTAKALMKTLAQRTRPIPTLYVKTLQHTFGPQVSVRQIFQKARQVAPCLLLFEDVDSMVTDEARSYFLNEVDGLEENDGILMVGSTNNLDKLNPGLSKRPSRFDRKYHFDNPSYEERVRYCEHWSQILSNKPAAAMAVTMPGRIASITEEFSFAYLKEIYIASLLALARETELSQQFDLDEDVQK